MTLKRVALTGGIGSGKTTVCQYFQKLGTKIIDADVITHQFCKPKSHELQTIIYEFGEGILDNQNRLNRDKLRQIVFSNPEKRKILETILHPLIYQEIDNQYQNLTQTKPQLPYCIIAIPLLIETNPLKSFNSILVIDTPKKLQLQRIIERDNISYTLASHMLHAQEKRELRNKIATDIIINDRSLKHLEQEVNRLHLLYCKY